jgi:hypothetical protein
MRNTSKKRVAIVKPTANQSIGKNVAVDIVQYPLIEAKL